MTATAPIVESDARNLRPPCGAAQTAGARPA